MSSSHLHPPCVIVHDPTVAHRHLWDQGHNERSVLFPTKPQDLNSSSVALDGQETQQACRALLSSLIRAHPRLDWLRALGPDVSVVWLLPTASRKLSGRATRHHAIRWPTALVAVRGSAAAQLAGLAPTEELERKFGPGSGVRPSHLYVADVLAVAPSGLVYTLSPQLPIDMQYAFLVDVVKDSASHRPLDAHQLAIAPPLSWFAAQPNSWVKALPTIGPKCNRAEVRNPEVERQQPSKPPSGDMALVEHSDRNDAQGHVVVVPCRGGFVERVLELVPAALGSSGPAL